MFDQIQPNNLQEIIEGIIKRLHRLQRELDGAQRKSQETQQKIDGMRSCIQVVKTNFLSEVRRIPESLVYHASPKQSYSYIGCTDTGSFLDALQKDKSAHYCTCKGG